MFFISIALNLVKLWKSKSCHYILIDSLSFKREFRGWYFLGILALQVYQALELASLGSESFLGF